MQGDFKDGKPFGKIVGMSEKFIVICYCNGDLSDDSPPVGKFIQFIVENGKASVEIDEEGGS